MCVCVCVCVIDTEPVMRLIDKLNYKKNIVHIFS